VGAAWSRTTASVSRNPRPWPVESDEVLRDLVPKDSVDRCDPAACRLDAAVSPPPRLDFD